MVSSSAGARNLQLEAQITFSDKSVLTCSSISELEASHPCFAQGIEKYQTEKCVNWIDTHERGGQGKGGRRGGECCFILC